MLFKTVDNWNIIRAGQKRIYVLFDRANRRERKVVVVWVLSTNPT